VDSIRRSKILDLIGIRTQTPRSSSPQTVAISIALQRLSHNTNRDANNSLLVILYEMNIHQLFKMNVLCLKKMHILRRISYHSFRMLDVE
jgi:hypothetical protein